MTTFPGHSRRVNRRIAPVSRLTVLLFAICLLDLFTTLWLVLTRRAAEANPLMDIFLAHSVGAFVAAKLALSILPLAVLEWARPHRPVFVRQALFVAIAAYLASYAIGVARANIVPDKSYAAIDAKCARLRARLHVDRSVYPYRALPGLR